jgi:predicted PhzF superfamily epimerase YddE/YHI9
MSIPLYQVDAFTSVPFRGNPAAVCLLPGPAGDGWMQAVAAEMNLSETAFLHPEGEAFRLRWFTPAVEVDLCGHATLASAHVLWETGGLDRDQPARFRTRSGLLSAKASRGWIELDFPALPAAPAEPPPGLLEALRIAPRWVGRARFDYLVEVSSEAEVVSLAPDFLRLAGVDARGVIVTASADADDRDFVSRFFAPRAGIDEDPVTGSAHCCLGPFWGERLDKSDLVGQQASPRGGTVRVSLRGDRVSLGGQAVTILRGELAPRME